MELSPDFRIGVCVVNGNYTREKSVYLWIESGDGQSSSIHILPVSVAEWKFHRGTLRTEANKIHEMRNKKCGIIIVSSNKIDETSLHIIAIENRNQYGWTIEHVCSLFLSSQVKLDSLTKESIIKRSLLST